MPQPAASALVAWEGLLRFHRRTTTILDAELRTAVGLALEEFDVLHQLSGAASGGMRMTELSAATLIARSSCSRLVDTLVGRAYVERLPDSGDRRAVRVRLTAAGRGAERQALAIHRAGIHQHFDAHLEERDISELNRIFRTLAAPAPAS